MRARVAILDYGSGNLRSLLTAIASAGASGRVVRAEGDLKSASVLLLPGVGSAVGALSTLRNSWMFKALSTWNKAKRPVLGICLGAQLMFEWLDEADSAGLGWLPGSVRPLPDEIARHTGWSELDFSALESAGLSTRLSPSATFYFNHQYHLPNIDTAVGVATRETFSTIALIRRENLIGVQFHPEKSQAAGSQLLRNIFEVN